MYTYRVVCEHNAIVSAILRRSESDLQKALIRCDPDNGSPRNGLCAVHFAVFWPTALRRLILAGVDINVQDETERRPIQLAVAMGIVGSVKLLIEADCSLNTSDSHPSLVQECSQLKKQNTREQISTLIIHGMINRHRRLLSLASAVLPPSSQLFKLIVPGTLQQSLVTMMMEEMSCLGHEIPTALKLDNKGHYESGYFDFDAAIPLRISTAEQLWHAGFQELESPYHVTFPKLTLVLQAWYNADFDILRWLIFRGASPFAKHPLTGGSGLHWFARRLSCPGLPFNHNISRICTDVGLVSQLGRDNSAWRDSCSCLCSIGGCQPVTTFLKIYHSCMSDEQPEGLSDIFTRLREFWAKLPPPPQQVLAQAEAVLRFFAFDQTNARHAAGCCRFDDDVKHSKRLPEPNEYWRDADVSDQEPTVLHDHEMIEKKMRDYRRKLIHCGCLRLETLVCVIFRDTCPNANRKRARYRRRQGRSVSIRFPWHR